ncbi:hypothetical protein [Asticcacaulis benevestitus]|uniref:Uncharacterized protein n=1 Tax=Asticcacaulis benevestitus DSM 16100 = ATCC BAA-896 TaxID=1121022 RepID=V4Q7D9_9CAUL|nr:hypothetical protein [Asticcacaulis benevestitus]ESQ93770.1 hypothetical protein ABENE_05470 [Asticcacaulis benevestitus DSM 16100 = ATCC BAA-896]
MNRVCHLAIAFAVCASAALPTSSFAQTGAELVEAGKILYWWATEGGPKLQKALGTHGFEAAEIPHPFFVVNQVDRPVTIYIESESCERAPLQLDAASYNNLTCETNEGDRDFNVSVGRVSYGVSAGDLIYIEQLPDGSLEIFDHTAEFMAKAQREGLVQ